MESDLLFIIHLISRHIIMAGEECEWWFVRSTGGEYTVRRIKRGHLIILPVQDILSTSDANTLKVICNTWLE